MTTARTFKAGDRCAACSTPQAFDGDNTHDPLCPWWTPDDPATQRVKASAAAAVEEANELQRRVGATIAAAGDVAISIDPRRLDQRSDRQPLEAFGVNGCPSCGMRYPTDRSHARACLRRPAGADAIEDAMRTSHVAEALHQLAGIGSDVCALLDAVQGGATLVLTGPDPLGSKRAPRFGASLESATRAREAHALGDDLPRVLSDLAANWRSQ